MESYNRLISHALHRNIYDYLDNQPHPDALSSGILYGGKRVRAHPQAGNTAYNHEPASLIPQHSLMQHRFIENLEGGKKYNVDKFISDFKKIGNVLKPVAKPILSAMTNKAVEKIDGAGRVYEDHEVYQGSGAVHPLYQMEGGKYNVDKFVKDFKKIGQVLKPVAKPILSALTQKATEKIEGAGKRRGRPKKLHGGASELYPPTVAKGGARKSTKKTTKSVSNKKSERGQLISKIMKEKGLNLGQASKYIKEHNLM